MSHIIELICQLILTKIPYELWKIGKSYLKYFKVWEYLAMVNIPLNKK